MNSAKAKPAPTVFQKPLPQLVPALDWTQRRQYIQHLAELKRMSVIEGQREKQMILAAERAVELRYLRRKAILEGK